ncbi:MAG: class I SAM-dependent methyltransferase, partial [Candidatus Omnitrophica bacterium]|nr:class I SAM-dependent methyltransferase [Candidatus Omnitrophota bacterium]
SAPQITPQAPAHSLGIAIGDILGDWDEERIRFFTKALLEKLIPDGMTLADIDLRARIEESQDEESQDLFPESTYGPFAPCALGTSLIGNTWHMRWWVVGEGEPRSYIATFPQTGELEIQVCPEKEVDNKASNRAKVIHKAELSPFYDNASKNYADVVRLIDSGQLTQKAAKRYAHDAADAFMQCFTDNGGVLLPAVDIISKIGFHTDYDIAKNAKEPLYAKIIEPLWYCGGSREKEILYIINTRVAMHARKAVKELDEWYDSCGIKNEADIFGSIEAIRAPRNFRNVVQRSKIKKIFIPSRITLGFDIFFSTITIQAALKYFPDAEIIFLDSTGSMTDLLDGLKDKITIINDKAIEYSRKGQLEDRYRSNARIARFIERRSKGLNPDEFLVWDTDTRISQTGTIPLAKSPQSHLYFTYEITDKELEEAGGDIESIDNLGVKYNKHLRDVFGPEEYSTIYPALWPKDSTVDKIQKMLTTYQLDSRFTTMLSLGVGGNYKKALKTNFEKKLALSLIEEDVVPVLDRGPVLYEEIRNLCIVEELQKKGKTVTQIFLKEKDTDAPEEIPIGEFYEAESKIYIDDTEVTPRYALQHVIANHGRLKKNYKGRVEIREENQKALSGTTSDAYTVRFGMIEHATMIANTNSFIGYVSHGERLASVFGVPSVRISPEYFNPAYYRRLLPFGHDILENIFIPAAMKTHKRKPTDMVMEKIKFIKSLHDLPTLCDYREDGNSTWIPALDANNFEIIDRCEVCSPTEKTFIGKIIIKGERGPIECPIAACPHCHLKWLYKRPRVKEIGKIYECPEYHSSPDDLSRLAGQAHAPETDKMVQRVRIDELERFHPEKGRVLEVGFGQSRILEEAKRRGWDVEGVDMSNRAVREARKKGLQVHQGEFNSVELDSERYDAVLSYCTMEHVPSPHLALQKIHKILRPDGVAIIRIPNFTDNEIPALDLLHHYYHFTSQSFEQLLQQNGFSLINKFDSGTHTNKLGTVRSVTYVIKKTFEPAAGAADVSNATPLAPRNRNTRGKFKQEKDKSPEAMRDILCGSEYRDKSFKLKDYRDLWANRHDGEILPE